MFNGSSGSQFIQVAIMLWRFFTRGAFITLIFAMASRVFAGVISEVLASGDVSNQPPTEPLIAIAILAFGWGPLGLFILLLAGFRAGSETALNIWGIIAALLMGFQFLLVFGWAKMEEAFKYKSPGSHDALLWGMALVFSASLVAYFLLGNRRLKRTRAPDAA